MRILLASGIAILLAASIVGCQRRTETTHEEEGIAVTAWGERYEIFAEPTRWSARSRSRTACHDPGQLSSPEQAWSPPFCGTKAERRRSVGNELSETESSP